MTLREFLAAQAWWQWLLEGVLVLAPAIFLVLSIVLAITEVSVYRKFKRLRKERRL